MNFKYQNNLAILPVGKQINYKTKALFSYFFLMFFLCFSLEASELVLSGAWNWIKTHKKTTVTLTAFGGIGLGALIYKKLKTKEKEDRGHLYHKNGEIQFKSKKIPVFEKILKRFNNFKVEDNFQKKIDSEKENIKTIDDSIIWNVTELVKRMMPELKEEDGVCRLIKTLVKASVSLLPEDPNEVLVGACKPVFFFDSNKLLTGASKSFLAGFPDGLEIESSNEDLFYKNFSTNDLMWLCKAAFVFGEDTVMKKSKLYMLKELTGINGIFPLKRFGKVYNKDQKIPLSYSISGGFSIGKNKIVTISDDGTTILRNLNGKLLQRFGKRYNKNQKIRFRYSINGGFLVDKDRFVTFSHDKAAILRNLNGKLLQRFGKRYNKDQNIGHVDWINGGFLVDKNRFVTFSSDHTAIFWNLNGKLLQKFGTVKNNDQNIGHINCISGGFLVDKNRFVTFSHDGTAILWNLNGKLLQKFGMVKNNDQNIGHVDWIRGGFLVDKNRFVTFSHDGTAILWNLNGELLQRFSTVKNNDQNIGHVDWIRGGFLVDKSRFVTFSHYGTAILWNLNGELLQRFSTVKNEDQNIGHVDWINGAFLVDKSRFVTFSYDGTAILWDLDYSFKDINFESAELCYKLFNSNTPIEITTGDDNYELFKQFPIGLQELAIEKRKTTVINNDLYQKKIEIKKN